MSKNERRKIQRRVRTVKRALGMTMLISSIQLLNYTGLCENGLMNCVPYVIRASICLVIFGFSAYVYDVLFGDEPQ